MTRKKRRLLAAQKREAYLMKRTRMYERIVEEVKELAKSDPPVITVTMPFLYAGPSRNLRLMGEYICSQLEQEYRYEDTLILEADPENVMVRIVNYEKFPEKTLEDFCEEPFFRVEAEFTDGQRK